MGNALLKSFGQRVRQLRLTAEITQEELAEKCSFHRTYMGMVERGERNISLKNISKIASAFELQIDELLKDLK